MEPIRKTLTLDKLTVEQKGLLVQLVNFGVQRKIGPVLVPIPAGPMDYVLYVYGESSLRIERLSDLDALCGAGCIDYRLNRMGNAKVYLLTQKSYRLVEEWRNEKFPIPQDVDQEPFLDEISLTKEILYNSWGELQQRLPARLPGDIRERLYWVMDELAFQIPAKSRISFQLRRIGRHFAEGLHDGQSAVLFQAYARWVKAIYNHLES